MESRGLPAYIAEFVGTFLLLFAVTMVATTNSAGGLGVVDWAVIGLLHVFVIAMLIAAFGGASGAHFNPAVTLTMLGLKKIAPIDAAIYFVAQIVGAILAVLLVKVTLNAGDGALNAAEAAKFGAPSVAADNRFIAGTVPAIVLEAIGTFMLITSIVGVVFNTAASSAWAPWIIGGIIGAGVMIIGPMTGAGFNPARSFAPTLIAGDVEWGTHLLIYWLGPILGAGAAGVLFQTVFLGRDT